jgi:outer membrane translocation and assembly module TamA
MLPQSSEMALQWNESVFFSNQRSIFFERKKKRIGTSYTLPVFFFRKVFPFLSIFSHKLEFRPNEKATTATTTTSNYFDVQHQLTTTTATPSTISLNTYTTDLIRFIPFYDPFIYDHPRCQK